MPGLLSAPLPRVWDKVEGGLAEPIRTTISHSYPHLAAGDMDHKLYRDNMESYRARLESDVLTPLDQ